MPLGEEGAALAADEPLDGPPPAPAEVPIQVRPAGRRTVLVVDDEPEIRLLLQRSLEKHGYAVETAVDGAEAIAKAEALVPDLVLLDAMLPKVHGFEACQRMKASPRCRHVPVIMMTAIYRGWRFAQDARDTYGAEDYIEKPFRFEDVLRRIDAVLEATASRSRGDGAAAAAEVARGKELLLANRLPEARAAFEAAIAADPYSAEAHAQLARTLRAAGEAFSAMTAFEKAAELRPGHLPSLRALAALYEEKGFRRKATETLERALGAGARRRHPRRHQAGPAGAARLIRPRTAARSWRRAAACPVPGQVDARAPPRRPASCAKPRPESGTSASARPLQPVPPERLARGPAPLDATLNDAPSEEKRWQTPRSPNSRRASRIRRLRSTLSGPSSPARW